MKWISTGHFTHEKGSKSFRNKMMKKKIVQTLLIITMLLLSDQLRTMKKKWTLQWDRKRIQRICLWLWVVLNSHLCEWLESAWTFCIAFCPSHFIHFIFFFVSISFFLMFSQCGIWNFIKVLVMLAHFKALTKNRTNINFMKLYWCTYILYYSNKLHLCDCILFSSSDGVRRYHHQNEIVR